MLTDWGKRRNGFEIINDINRQLSDIPGVRAFANMQSAFGRGGGGNKPIQFVIKGPSYETLVEWRNTFVDALNKENPGIGQIDWDYKETQQQFRVNVDYIRASDLGVTVQEIGSTLQTMLGSKRVGTFVQNGEERYVIFEGERTEQATPSGPPEHLCPLEPHAGADPAVQPGEASNRWPTRADSTATTGCAPSPSMRR